MSNQMNISLVMFTSDGTRRDFPLKKERTVVGRTNSCDLRIPLSSVSRQHCEILVEGHQLSLKDLDSSNGTFLNNHRVEQTILEPGDEIVVGPVVFTLVIDGEPAHIDPVRSVVQTAGKVPARAAASKGKVQPASAVAGGVHEDRDRGRGLSSTMDTVSDASGEASAIELDSQGSGTDMDNPVAALEAMATDGESSDELPVLEDDKEELSA